MLCTKCKIEKPETQFNWRNKAQARRHTHCKVCQRDYKRAFYERTADEYKAKVVASNDKRKERNNRHVLDHLLTHPCVDCGIQDPVVLEFDHVRGDKKTEISKMIQNKVSLATLDAEIAKCDVVCANCHRRRTFERGSYWRWTTGSLLALAKGWPRSNPLG